jgi:hypothetical protein
MNCADVVYMVGSLQASSQVITDSSNVVSLITRVLGREALNVFSLHFGRDITRFLHHVMTSPFTALAASSLNRPVAWLWVIVFFMEDFEGVTLDRAMCKPLCSLWYVNDGCVIWPHGTQNLKHFFEQFTREMERIHHLSFLDMDIYRRCGCLHHKSHHKPTHTTIYLNCGLCLLSSNSQALLCALVHRAKFHVIEISFTMTGVSEAHFQAE